jgi:hypothetical protein
MLAQSEPTKAIAEQLRDSYILLIELPDTGVRRRLIRSATDQVVIEKGMRGRSIPDRLGLTATPIKLDIPGASQTASYHAEISVPRGCVLTSANVHDTKGIPTSQRLIRHRATVYVAQPTDRDAKLQLEVNQERSFYLLPATVIGALICVVLTAGVAVAWAGGKPQSTASALLLSGLSTIGTGDQPRRGLPDGRATRSQPRSVGCGQRRNPRRGSLNCPRRHGRHARGTVDSLPICFRPRNQYPRSCCYLWHPSKEDGAGANRMNLSRHTKKGTPRRGSLTIASSEAGRLSIPEITLKQLDD